MRVNRYLSYCGICSRREADRLIEQGIVVINGKTAVPGDQADEDDIVVVEGKTIHPPTRRSYYALYKPYGVICSFAENEKNSLRQFVGQNHYLTYAGRLDVRSEGLLVLTDDGDLINKLMTGRNGHEKEYIVETEKPVSEAQLDRMRKGLFLPGLNRNTRPCKAEKTGENEFHIILTQGMNRQIRRMCEETGVQVKTLKRIRIENILLGELKPGEKRKLSNEEMDELFSRLG